MARTKSKKSSKRPSRKSVIKKTTKNDVAKYKKNLKIVFKPVVTRPQSHNQQGGPIMITDVKRDAIEFSLRHILNVVHKTACECLDKFKMKKNKGKINKNEMMVFKNSFKGGKFKE